ncbi:MAG: hypothetical protein EA369_09480, partial [Bradymonadales bacterium]
MQDFCPFKEITDDGLFLDSDGSQGFALRLHGIDVSTYTDSDWNSLHERWRSFLWLQPNEEIQIVYRKNTNFEELFEKKLEDLHLIQDPLRKKLYWKQIDELVALIGQKARVFSSSLLLTYRRFEGTKPGSKPNSTVTLQQKELEDRLQSLCFQLEEMGISQQKLSKREIHKEIFSSIQHSNYISSP